MGDLPPIAQFLLLDPVSIGDQQYTRSDELRRALGISFGSTTEDNSFGASHLKFPPPLATEELKRLKASVLETSRKARFRAKRFDELLHKLNKYCEGLVSKKQQRNEMLTNDRSGGSNLLRIGTQFQRDASHASQRLEDRPNTSGLNKRVRSSIAETRAEGRSSSITRQTFMGKDKDFPWDGGEGSDIVEENIRRLPAGGESWDRKMKRKRSVAAVFARPSDSDGEPKRVMHHKLNNEPSLQPADSQSFRSGISIGLNGTNNLDGTSLPPSSNARVVHKNELEKVSLSRDSIASLNKERFIVKGNKLSVMDNHMLAPIPLAKGKASARGPRSGPATPGNLTPNFPRSLGALDGWDQPSSLNEVHSVNGTNNRKRQMSTSSSSPPMAQWVGQRSQKVSRTRRANLVSPVPNHDEVQLPSERCSPSELSGRMASPATNGSLLAKGVGNRNQQNRIKHEIVSSPARLSESEESGTGENHENRLKEKRLCNGVLDERALSNVQNNSPSMLLTKKNKVLTKEDDGDSVRRQGRIGRGTSLSRQSVSPLREKLDSPTSTKLLKSTRPGSEKNGRRPPLKKLTDRKALSRVGHTFMGGSSDICGESEDDLEELLAAAKYASNARNIACSSAFWRKMESVFAAVSLEDVSFLKKQLKYSEENNQITTRIHGRDSTNLGDLRHVDNSLLQILSSGVKSKCLQDRNGSKHLPGMDDLVDQVVGTVSGELALEKSERVPPLFQRVLSALIAEDPDKEFQESDEGENRFSQFCGDDFHSSMHVSDDNGPRSNIRIDFELESTWCLKTQKQFADRLSCNGSTTSPSSMTFRNQLFKDELVETDCQFVATCNGVYHESAENGLDGSLALHMNASAVSSQSLEDRLLLELQSIGLFPETVPDLADGEDDAINQEILELERELTQKISKKENHLNRILKEVQEGREMDDRVHREQVAMDRLVELAYRKLVATRGSIASKMGVPKVPKPVALAFMKRTLARCRRFEDTGERCFNEPGLRDALLARPTCIDIEPMDGTGPASVSKHDNNVKGSRGSFHSSDLDFAKTGPISNRGKKKEVLLDDVGGTASTRAVSDVGGTLLGGAKGKRSERERGKDLSTTKKSGRPSTNNFRGERKNKTKPKQKRVQLSPSRNDNFANSTFLDCAFTSAPNEVVATGSNSQREPDLAAEFANLPLPDLDSIELGDANDLGGHQDLSSWLNFDDDGLQGDDFAGLEIPMDDLSELNLQI